MVETNLSVQERTTAYIAQALREKRDGEQAAPAQSEAQVDFTTPLGLSFLKHTQNGNAMTLSAVFSAIEIISSSVAQIPIHVRQRADGTILESHPVYDALDSSLILQFTMLKQVVSDTLVYGNGYIYIVRDDTGSPRELVYLPHTDVTMHYDNRRRRITYTATSVSKRPIEDCDMVHVVKTTKNGVEGIGVLDYARSIISLSNATQKQASDYFEGGCNVNGILKSNRILSDKQRQDIRESWQQVHGPKGSGQGVVVIGADLEYKDIGSNAAESQMLETRQFNVEEIARFFTISPTLLGDLSHTAYNSIEQSQLQFLLHCLAPWIQLIEQEFNRKLLKPSERKHLYIDFDEEHIIRADRRTMAEYVTKLVTAGVLTRNEARHLLGYQPVDGGDDLQVAYTDVTQNTIGKNTADKEDE